jgi:DNA-binding NarL/FixJ family response regulator
VTGVPGTFAGWIAKVTWQQNRPPLLAAWTIRALGLGTNLLTRLPVRRQSHAFITRSARRRSSRSRAAIGEDVAEAFQLVGTVRHGRALFEAAKALTPDVIVADISVPGTDGLTAMKQIQKHLPHVSVILLTNRGEAELVRDPLAAGASGFVLNAYAPTELVHAIRTAVDGGTCVSSAIAV